MAITLSICSFGFSIFVFSETRENAQSNFNSAAMAIQSNNSIPDQIVLGQKQDEAIEITVSEDGFSLSGIRISPNQLATISITNTGEKPHSFVVDELEIDTGLIKPGQTKKIEFSKDIKSPESFEFYSNAEGDNKEKITGLITIF